MKEQKWSKKELKEVAKMQITRLIEQLDASTDDNHDLRMDTLYSYREEKNLKDITIEEDDKIYEITTEFKEKLLKKLKEMK